ncbi:hypothetical protein HQ585_11820 [candidate division KSB1 bacterium]|nr:hypothetical protein [candidate division KSB1 bacterium]
MPRQISIDKIVDATLAGIKFSHKQYYKWSNGGWLWTAPEYLLTINIANKISEIEGAKFITLENGARYAIEDAGALKRGRLPQDIRERGRVDILVWWGKDEPRAVIEVKNFIYDHQRYEKDIKRIKEFLKRKPDNSSLQFGLFAYCDSADTGKILSAEEKINNKRDKINFNIETILGDNFEISFKTTNLFKVDESAWQATCFLIRYKPN